MLVLCPTVFDEESLTHENNNMKFFNVRVQEKKPHKATIENLVKEKVNSIKETTGQKVNKHELNNIKDDAHMKVLATTVPESPKDFTVVFFPITGILFVEAPNEKKAKEILEPIVHACGGSIPLTGVAIPNQTENVCEGMLQGSTKEPFTLGSSVVMVDNNARKNSNHEW